MNSKIAKTIRKVLGHRTSFKPTTYTDKVMKKEHIPTMRRDTTGNPIMVEYKGELVPEFYTLDKVTRYLDAKCSRGLYQQAKKTYKENHRYV